MREVIISAYAEDSLLSWIADTVKHTAAPEREVLFALVERLHVAGEIDALGALLNPAAQWDWTPEWLAKQQVLTALVPRLAAPITRMMALIAGIEAGMVQHVLDDTFLTWCAAEPSRPAQVITLVDGGADVSDRFVLAALIAGLRTNPQDYLAISASMTKGDRPGGRHIGARALGLMLQTEDASVACAVEALQSVIEDRGLAGQVRADALSAAIDIAVRVPAASSEQFLALLHRAADDSDPGLLDACASAFGRHAITLPPPLFESMLEILPKLQPDRIQAFNIIDVGLYSLLSNPSLEERALQVIEALVRREDGDVIFERLDSARHAISNGNGPRLSRVVTKWLLSGEAPLCAAGASLVRGVYGRELSLSVDFPLSDAEASFLARKAIGWLLAHPLAATSLIISLLPQVSDAGVQSLADLLFNPLLMNYPGSVRRLIEATVPTSRSAAGNALTETIAKHDSYLRGIEAIGKVPELHQNERNRRIEFQRQNDQMSAARRDAEKQSVLLSMVRKTRLLHGVRTIGYVEDFGGGTRRLDNKLGRVTTEMERAMQWTFDPIGLEHTLLKFRLERPPG